MNESVTAGLAHEIAGSVTAGRGMPAAAYTDPGYHQLERQRLFARSWICIGTVDDVAEPGSVCPIDFAGFALIMTRAKDGALRVFHNYCRHRGMRLVKQPCAGQLRIVCPYHAWSYRLDGRLDKTPHIGGPNQHDPAAAGAEVPEGLEPVRSALWHRLVFVDLSGEAVDFENHIAPLAERWARFDLAQLRPGVRRDYEVAANWKLAVENFVDVYHLPTVHPAMNRYNDMSEHYYVHEPSYFGEGNRTLAPSDAAVGRMPLFPKLPEEDKGIMEAFCLFPNLLITVFCDHLRVILVEPDGAERCRERVEVFVVGETALDPELEDARAALLARFDSFNREDVEIVEALQTSMSQSRFRAAHFSPQFDAAVRLFQDRVVETIGTT